MFSVIDALLLRPLPYPEPNRLVEVWAANPEAGGPPQYVPPDAGRVWAERGDLFEAAFFHRRGSVLYAGGAEPIMLTVKSVSPGFEETLSVAPALGRGFTGVDAHPAAEPVMLLSDAFWRTAFGADPGVLGRVIDLDGVGHRIIGVMPTGFKFPTYASTEVWRPLREDGAASAPDDRPLRLVARLRAGVPIEAAQARADVLAASLADARPRDGGWSVRLVPFNADRGYDSTRRAIWFLTGAVGLMLLIATLNGTNLLLVRGWARIRESAVRAALGASRRRMVAQLMTESLIFAVASGTVAIVLAIVVLWLIQGIIPSDVTFFAPHEIAIERRTLLFTFVLAVAAGFAVGLVPAILASRHGAAAPQGALTPYAARTPVRSRLRRAFVVAEVAFSVALLIGAGLLMNSVVRLMRVDPGLRLENIAIMSLSLSPRVYPTGEARMEFLRALEARLEALPGVAGATTGGGPDDLQANLAFLLPASGSASSYASVAIRTTADPQAIFSSLRATVHELDPNQPISELQTAKALYADTVQMPRFLLVLMSALASLALLLTAVGLYGVLAYGVAQRRFDLGVRIALGARPATLSRQVLGEGLVLAGAGVALGLAGALALSGLIRGLLFGVEPGDPVTIAAVVAVSLSAAAAASWWPARRTLRIDPVEVLKAN